MAANRDGLYLRDFIRRGYLVHSTGNDPVLAGFDHVISPKAVVSPQKNYE